jgi:hypothetical protein
LRREPAQCAHETILTPDKFYKRSQEKNTSPTAGSFIGFQPGSLSRIVLAFRSAVSGRYAQLRSAFGFPCQRFSSL